jgi:hypothetical protein
VRSEGLGNLKKFNCLIGVYVAVVDMTWLVQ